MIGTRSRIDQNPRVLRCSEAAETIAVAIDSSSAGVASGSTSPSMRRPAARSPLRVSSHRGLSGMPKHLSV